MDSNGHRSPENESLPLTDYSLLSEVVTELESTFQQLLIDAFGSEADQWSLMNDALEHFKNPTATAANRGIQEDCKPGPSWRDRVAATPAGEQNPELGEQKEDGDLMKQIEALKARLNLSEEAKLDFQQKFEKSEYKLRCLAEENQLLKEHLEYFVHQEIEQELSDWDLCEDPDVPQPHKVVMKLPAQGYISMERRKQLKNLSAAVMAHANNKTRELIAAVSQQPLEETVVPVIRDIAREVVRKTIMGMVPFLLLL